MILAAKDFIVVVDLIRPAKMFEDYLIDERK